MKTKNKIFNYKLYLDGIRQLKLIGIMSIVIMSCAAFFVPLGYNIQNANSAAYNLLYYGYETSPSSFSYDMIDLNPLIFVVFLFTVIFTLSLFSFMNSRNASDFYHSIPDTRKCIFLSYCGSILTWDVLLLVISYIISLVCAAGFKYVTLSTEGFVKPFCSSLAGCVFVLGVIVIAMSLTGTLFANQCVAVMIAAFPRSIVTFYMYLITYDNPFVDFVFGGSILDDRLNVVTNLVTGTLIRGDYEAWNMYKSIIYTLIVGLVYCFIGGVLFTRRKSETAVSPAASGWLQCVFRLIPSSLICLIPISIIFDGIICDYGLTSYEIFGIAVVYVISMIAYFAYELATTKKLKNVLKSAKGLFGLFVFNVMIIVCGIIGSRVLTEPISNPEKLSYAQIVLSYNDTKYYYGTEDFFDDVLNEKNTSKEFVAFLVKIYNENLEYYNNGGSLYSYPYSNNEMFNCVEVKFGSGLFAKTRCLFFTAEQEKQLVEYISGFESYKDKLSELENLNGVSMISVDDEYIVSDEAKREIFDAFRQEFLAMDALDIIRYETGINYYGKSTRLCMATEDNKWIYINMGDDFPKTKSVIFSFVK